MRIVLEAKIGGAEPTVEQLLKYGTEHRLWKQYKTRGIVALIPISCNAAVFSLTRVDGFPLSRE